MSGSAKVKETSSKRRALNVWELPKLLTSVHRHRKASTKAVRTRKHFNAILAFCHRNRFCVASQIQRRFSTHLRSDRTARRHLAEMESLGLLEVVETNNVSPLWPKVYFVTRRGLGVLRKALNDQGQEWTECIRDRRRSDGAAAQHVLHELMITEFQLLVWETSQARSDIQILTMQRRSLATHAAFKVVVAGRQTRLQPDGMFLYRQEGRGMMCCFLELDLDSMSIQQMAVKLRRYQFWAESKERQSYLKDLYKRQGATNPVANFRLLLLVGGRNQRAETTRLKNLMALIAKCPAVVRDRIWLSGIERLHETSDRLVLNEPLWLRMREFSITNGDTGLNAVRTTTRHAMFGIPHEISSRTTIARRETRHAFP